MLLNRLTPTLVLATALLVACTPAAATVTSTAVPTVSSTIVPTAIPTTVPPSTPAATATAASYTDPFAFCQYAGNADTPGPLYTGPKMTEPLANALKKASGAAPDAPLDMFMQASSWRCMDGKVYACFVGANLPCDSKANTDPAPTSAETDFCKANPASDFIPAVVTGHETVFEWRCKGGKPETGKQVWQVDARGYIADIWYALPAP